jgi:peptidoglycan L-alanyl-D-glutamate endopeptidase CwlK
MFNLSSKSQLNMAGVNPQLVSLVNKALEISLIDFGIPNDGGLRTAERQRELFNQKLSKLDGFTKKSKHQSGKAIDFYAFVDGKASWAPEHLSLVACAFLQAASQLGIKVQWGGLWKGFRDMPHIELID